MKKILLFLFLFASSVPLSAQVQITHAALIGVWSYFHITTDTFATNKMIATEQRITFQDGQNAQLTIVAEENEYYQNTAYQLKYALSLKDGIPYLTLFSSESKQVLGGYMRMPYNDSLEMASDPNFRRQKQLYQRKSPVLPMIAPPSRKASMTTPTNIDPVNIKS